MPLPRLLLTAALDGQYAAVSAAVNVEVCPVRELYHGLRLAMTRDSGRGLPFEQCGGRLGLGVHIRHLPAPPGPAFADRA